jgi:hypothetical protein
MFTITARLEIISINSVVLEGWFEWHYISQYIHVYNQTSIPPCFSQMVCRLKKVSIKNVPCGDKPREIVNFALTGMGSRSKLIYFLYKEGIGTVMTSSSFS